MYIHIPFCAHICTYCNFSRMLATPANAPLRQQYVQALTNHISLLPRTSLPTIYFGGGTPSTLSLEQVAQIMQAITRHHDTSQLTEITFEVNPEHVTPEYISGLASMGINRISMGVQSLNAQVLSTMNRRHTPEQVEKCTETILKHIPNLSLDLIFGFPGQQEQEPAENALKLIESGATHLSLYALQLEATQLIKKIDDNTLALPSETTVTNQYSAICKALEQKGWIHYEISNFAKSPDLASQHNQRYWRKERYHGIGMAASGYDGDSLRYTNTPNIRKYIADPLANQELDELTEDDLYNELVMLSLRTRNGLKLNLLNTKQRNYLMSQLRHINPSNFTLSPTRLVLNEEAYMVYNDVVSSLMI